MIISASRRTDIPAFYSEWFMNRVRAGFCTVPNPFNAHQVSTVSLRSEDVDAFVFWTRNPRPMLRRLPELDERGYNYIFEMTLLDYPQWLETSTPPVDAAVATFRAVAKHVGAGRMVWRYDPLVFTRSIDADYHRQKFGEIARALHGHSERVVISVVDDYAKTRRRLGALDEETPQPKERIADTAAFGALMRDLVAIACAHDMEIQSCAETLNLQQYGILPGKCIDDGLLTRLFGLDLDNKKDPSQRKECGCVVSKDIGVYNSCPFGCQYCYATASFDTARLRHGAHNPDATSLFLPTAAELA